MNGYPIASLRLVPSVRNRTRGFLIAGASVFDCAIGRGGIIVRKREGDGGTPRAILPLRRLFLRPDKGPRLPSALPARWLTRQDAWCDDIRDRRYNRLIQRPPGPAEERLWREDHLYDLIVELGWNDAPIRRGHGSAIFWHLPRPGLTATAGCMATPRAVFLKVLPRLGRGTRLIVAGARPAPSGARAKDRAAKPHMRRA
jgi:L,D-peptidoglycan transpeptidase YkuD (ErfK/YbiS/YcfS/YnhG family)